MISKQETLVQKVPQMKRFALTIAIESILDWFGIVLFASGFFITSDSRTFFTLGVCCMYFHCNVMAITFYQLKYISITQEENVPKKTIVFLKDLKKINATASLSSKVAEANTVKFYPQ
jgi:hypothetical protein